MKAPAGWDASFKTVGNDANGSPLWPFLFSIALEILSRATWQEKKQKESLFQMEVELFQLGKVLGAGWRSQAKRPGSGLVSLALLEVRESLISL